MTWIVPLTLGGLAIAVMALFSVIGARRQRLGHAAPSAVPNASILVHDINDDRCTGCDEIHLNRGAGEDTAIRYRVTVRRPWRRAPCFG